MQQLKQIWLDLPIRLKGNLVISIPVLSLAVLLLTVLVTDRQTRASQESVIRTARGRSEGQRLLTSVLEAQGAIRGYLFARDRHLLEPYQTAQEGVDTALAGLRTQVVDPEQMDRVRGLEALARDRMALLEQDRRLMDGGGPEIRRRGALLRNMNAGHPKMNAFRTLMQEFDDTATRLLAERSAQLAAHRSNAALFLWAGALLGITGGLIANLLFGRGVTDRINRLRDNAENISRGHFAEARPLGGDEIGRLGNQFEEMIYGLLGRELRLRDTAQVLAETGALQRAILDSADYTIISTDTEGTIRTFNRAAEQMLGYQADELVGRSTPAVFHDPDEVVARAAVLSQELGTEIAPGFDVFVARARRGETEALEWTYVGKNGSRTPVLLSITALRAAEGDVTGFLGIGSDSTERRRYERDLVEAREAALQASLAKSEFLATMSHEIRTPMNAIIGMADLLWDSPLSEDQRHYVSVFRRAGNTLLQLINDILDLSKVEAGQLELEEQAFDLRELAEQTVEFFSVRAHEKGLELACDVKPDVPEHVLGDAHRVRQILINLLGNAVKFTSEGEIVLRIRRGPGGETLLFEVSDTGPGIPPEKLGDIFEAFTQVDSSTTRRYGGTGLGLPIASRLAAAMRGAITVRSEVGHGSLFEFCVSLPPVDAPSAVAVPDVDLAGLKVLIVDDNATNRLILAEMVGGWGAVAIEVPGGAAALEAAGQAWEQGVPFRLVLLDGRMPDMDGFQVAGAMRRAGWWSDTTVMMLTSDNRAGDILRSREIGLAGYLVKPIKRGELLAAIQTALTGRSPSTPTPLLDPEILPVSPTPTPATPETLATPNAGKRILLVEDSPDNRMLVLAYLKRSPYQVDVAEDGEEAVRRFTGGQYDLVLMDVQMPVMDGYTATEAIRRWEREAGRAATPILALTANALREDEERSREAGCTGHLTKPIKKSVLLESLEQYLEGETTKGGASDGAA